MAIDPKQLPEDPAALRQIVIGLLEEVETKEAIFANCSTGSSNCCGRATGPGGSAWMSIHCFCWRR